MTIKELKQSIAELESYKRDKKTLYIKYINDRLSKSLQTYYKELHNAYIHELSVNKIINKGKP